MPAMPTTTPQPQAISAPTSTLTSDTGPGAAYGAAYAAASRAQGLSGAGVLRPLIDVLNAQTAMSPADKATAARVACNAQNTPGWGAGPVVVMPNGDLIVTSRMHSPDAPVLVVKPEGAVLRGTAYVEMLDETTCRVSDVREGQWPSRGVWVGPTES
jgi:hypothetical protein